VRLDAFDALNHNQFTGVNATVTFASLTNRAITNLPYGASGTLMRNNGFGSINAVAAPRPLQLVTRLTFQRAGREGAGALRGAPAPFSVRARKRKANLGILS
jgi:hypothetical protein